MTTTTSINRARDAVLAAVVALLIAVGAAFGLQTLDHASSGAAEQCAAADGCDIESAGTTTGFGWRD